VVVCILAKEAFAVSTFLLRKQSLEVLSCFPVRRIDIMKTGKNVPFILRKGNLSPHGETTLSDLVKIELKKCSPLVRDPDHVIVKFYTISGDVIPAPTSGSKFLAKIGKLTMKELLALFPNIVFTVTEVALPGGTTKKYKLTPILLNSATDQRLDDYFGTLSLVEIGVLLYNFTFQVDDVTSGSPALLGYYEVSAEPERRATPTFQPELYQKNHGDLTLDIIGDALEFMAFSIASVSKPSRRTQVHYFTGATAMTLYVCWNKIRRE
jgi:hypothetical protein